MRTGLLNIMPGPCPFNIMQALRWANTENPLFNIMHGFDTGALMWYSDHIDSITRASGRTGAQNESRYL